MCSESQSRNVESHLSKSSETKKKSENKTSAWAVLLGAVINSDAIGSMSTSNLQSLGEGIDQTRKSF